MQISYLSRKVPTKMDEFDGRRALKEFPPLPRAPLDQPEEDRDRDARSEPEEEADARLADDGPRHRSAENADSEDEARGLGRS